MFLIAVFNVLFDVILTTDLAVGFTVFAECTSSFILWSLNELQTLLTRIYPCVPDLPLIFKYESHAPFTPSLAQFLIFPRV
jgi:hypothetical protein